MQELFDLAFARLDRVDTKRREFGESWGNYISVHPWDIDVPAIEPCTFEILVVMREPAPIELSMIFSEWLAAIRAALDNGLYAWVAAITGQDPPPKAERIQYPICSTPEEFRSQRKRLSGVPNDILDKVEKAQPYQSPLRTAKQSLLLDSRAGARGSPPQRSYRTRACRRASRPDRRAS